MNIASLYRGSSIADAVALNPQPLPPKDSAVSLIKRSVLDTVALNPQPLPPKDDGSPLRRLLNSLDAVALNPQPLPPKDDGSPLLLKRSMLLDAVALNPQPLPPKDGASPQLLKRSALLDAVALNPQPLPPKDGESYIKSVLDRIALNPQPLPPKALAMVANRQDLAVKKLENAAAQADDWQKQSASHRDAVRDSILDLLRKMSEIKAAY